VEEAHVPHLWRLHGIDVEACTLDGPTAAAAAIVGRIGDRLPSA
jgi:hypothetical protein